MGKIGMLKVAQHSRLPLPPPSPTFSNPSQDLEDRESHSNTPVHVVNLDIKDNHESATVGAMNILQLANMVGLG